MVLRTARLGSHLLRQQDADSAGIALGLAWGRPGAAAAAGAACGVEGEGGSRGGGSSACEEIRAVSLPPL